MKVRGPVVAFTLVAVALLVPATGAGQGETYKVPRHPDGTPDISGTFNFATITPLQRPSALEGKDTLTPEEAAEFEAAENKRLNRDLFDPEKGQPSAGYAPRAQGGVLSYNEFWYERGSTMTEDKRTSLIVDPPSGRIPFTEEARRRNADRGQKLNTGFADHYTDRSLADRCILGFNSGPPMTPGAYNNNMVILQTPGQVVIVNEMINNARIIPTDGRARRNIRQWVGESRGRWEGDTLVVETFNFKQETSLSASTSDTKLVERFTRVGPDTVLYEFTAEDPNSYTSPWTAMVPLKRTTEQLYEYACHEGNYGLEGILAGARAKDKAEAEGKK